MSARVDDNWSGARNSDSADTRDVSGGLHGWIANADRVAFSGDTCVADVDIVVTGGEILPRALAHGNVG